MKYFTKLMIISLPRLFVTGAVLFSAFPEKQPAERPPDAELTNVVNVILGIGEFYRSPEPNHSLTGLVFMRYLESGCRLCKVDFSANTLEVLAHNLETRRLFSWSPDDRYHLFKDLNQGEWLRLYDSQEGC